MSKAKPKVFFDANVVIRAGKPPGGPLLQRTLDLVNAGLIEVLTTDHTIVEITKKHANNEYDVIKEAGRRHFRDLIEEHLGVTLPAKEKKDIYEAVKKKYAEQVSAMFKKLKARHLTVDKVKPSIVLKSLSEGTGFFSCEGKRDQFPDAFIFESLRSEATQTSPIIIVSDDGDFSAPVKSEEHITILTGIPELFAKIGLQIEAPEIASFLEDRKEELIAMFDKELGDWGLDVTDVPEAEIEECAVTNIEIGSVVTFRSLEDEGDILVTGTAEVTATVSYTHPNWDDAAWDSEDKVLIPFETVSGETEISTNIAFSLSVSVGAKSTPSILRDLSFRNSDFKYIELHPYNPYEY